MTRAVVPSDIDYVAANMRPEDIEEVGALGFDPLSALRLSHTAATFSMTLVCPKTGLPAAILGVTKLDDTFGMLWLLGTPAIENNTICFLRQGRNALPGVFRDSGCLALGNYVYARNVLHVKWLRWLGFKFLRRVHIGPMNEEFIEFVQLRFA